MQPPPPLPLDRPPLDTPPPPPPHNQMNPRRNMNMNNNMRRTPRNSLRPDQQGYDHIYTQFSLERTTTTKIIAYISQDHYFN